MRRRAYLGTVAGALAGTAGCVAGAFGGLSASDYDIGMGLNEFRPATYELSVGETVVWGNTNSRTHTVTAVSVPEGAAYFASGGYDSRDAADEAWHDSLGGGIEPGSTYEHTFEVAGTYDYYCIPHAASDMNGKIVVSE